MKEIKTEDIIEALKDAIQTADDWYDECTGSPLITSEMDKARDVLNDLRLQRKTFNSSCELNPEILGEVDFVTTEDEIAQNNCSNANITREICRKEYLRLRMPYTGSEEYIYRIDSDAIYDCISEIDKDLKLDDFSDRYLRPVNKEDEIAQDVAQFVLNHEQHILDNVSDFGLLLPMLTVIKDSLSE